MKLEIAQKREYSAVKRIYNEAFPPCERAPFRIIKRRAQSGSAQMLAAKIGDEIIGFAYVVANDKVCYLFYLAVRKDSRGGGVGTEIVRFVKDAYQGKKIFIAREKLDEPCDNYDMRVRRRDFYVRNGFTDIPRTIKEGPVRFDVMSIGGVDITRDEYLSLMENWGGSRVLKLVDMIYTD
ncbi:MAG: GNAT family N-acetyltransferase [Clostridiales bacterium]|nr:GNAT family N-acetyltransferase [Clostridiales bacterium]